MKPSVVPEFAIIGHPNEGKSSVLSTLAEDDTVRVSPIPGETTISQPFPVRIDGEEIIRFIDTPGFQNPHEILRWFQAYTDADDQMINAFLQTHSDDPLFHDDCELLRPIAEGAGVIFVADGSRPIRQVDRVEMEILRLSGVPRMAIINCKEEAAGYLLRWQNEFRKYFNAIRLFNPCQANYSQRIELLESLRAIDQELGPVLRRVIEAFQKDWEIRNIWTAVALTDMLKDVLSYRRSVPCSKEEEQKQREELIRGFQHYVVEREQQTRRTIRQLFKHNIFNLELPPQSILTEDLFSKQTWEFLGLNDRQLVVAGAMSGAAMGLGIDALTIGSSFGIFAAVGGLIGAGATALKGKELLSGIRLLGMRMAQDRLQVGPVNNIQLLYILLDRSLLFYSHIINWAHGRRDYERIQETAASEQGKAGFSTLWKNEERKICDKFFRAVQNGKEAEIEESSLALQELLRKQFQNIAEGKAD